MFWSHPEESAMMFVEQYLGRPQFPKFKLTVLFSQIYKYLTILITRMFCIANCYLSSSGIDSLAYFVNCNMSIDFKAQTSLSKSIKFI